MSKMKKSLWLMLLVAALLLGTVDMILIEEATALIDGSLGVTAAGPWKLMVNKLAGMAELSD